MFSPLTLVTGKFHTNTNEDTGGDVSGLSSRGADGNVSLSDLLLMEKA